ncbi:MAG TPA: response regulator transcription factor [Candidatus Aphodovivens avistercoris]|nr:response regulator transcription factor [Candidatus Aphodovivens avistercoris]
MRILLVEDDAAIVRALSELLRTEGYEVADASRQDDAIRLVERERFDAALLDVTLAQGTGFAVCAAAREAAPDMPIIFLTASDDEYSTVMGLDMGAVDYVAKPFRVRELLSRIRAALRRSGAAAQTLALGPVEIDLAAATARKNGADLELSALEYRLLLCFAQRAGRLVTRDALRDAIWDDAGEYVSDNALNVYIRRLREKIEDDPSDPRLIVTVRGMGYKAGA